VDGHSLTGGQVVFAPGGRNAALFDAPPQPQRRPFDQVIRPESGGDRQRQVQREPGELGRRRPVQEDLLPQIQRVAHHPHEDDGRRIQQSAHPSLRERDAPIHTGGDADVDDEQRGGEVDDRMVVQQVDRDNEERDRDKQRRRQRA